MLPPELIIKILGYTDYETLKNYREFDKKFIDNNIKFIFRKLCFQYPFLKYGNPEIKNFTDFENTWNMEQFVTEYEDLIFYIREFDVHKKNILDFLLINNIFHKKVTFHAAKNLKESNIRYFKKLCDENKDNYFQNYIRSVYF